MKKRLNKRARFNLVLLTLNLVYIFIISLFDSYFDTQFAYFIVITLIFLVSIFATNDSKGRFFYFPVIVIVLLWISVFFEMPILSEVSSILSTVFFLYVIVYLVVRVAGSKEVGPLEFLESVNVYLLLGIAGSLLFRAVSHGNPAAINLPEGAIGGQAQFIYYSFVTMTTLGYGDITPVSPLARSLSIFFSVSGQLYLTMIIALLVGKYLSRKA
jgi:voltage-gated potassium channel